MILPSKEERAEAKRKAKAVAKQREQEKLAKIEEERKQNDRDFKGRCDQSYESALSQIKYAIEDGKNERFIYYCDNFRYKVKRECYPHTFDELKKRVIRRINRMKDYKAALHTKYVSCNNHGEAVCISS